MRYFPRIVFVAFIIPLAFWAVRPNQSPAWTGFGDYHPSPPGVQPLQVSLPPAERAKTLWDWMELLLIPGALAGVALLINRSMKKREQESAEDHIREQSLQEYYKEISMLLLERGLYPAKKNDDVRFVAMAYTNNVFRRLDGQRKGVVLSFLRSLDLITCSITSDWELKQSDEKPRPLIVITQTDLSNLVLPRGLWRGARMTKIYVIDTEFSGADLSDVDLSESVITDSWFQDVDLSKSNLSGCDLRRSVFLDVNLEGTNFKNANLRGAIVLAEDLKKADSLEGCIMFDGNKYDPSKSLEEQAFDNSIAASKAANKE